MARQRSPSAGLKCSELKKGSGPTRFAPSIGMWGATGFDGFGEDIAACPGCQSPGKTTGNIHNCQFKPGTGCVSFGFTHLREWQPARGGAPASQKPAGGAPGPDGACEST